MTEMQQLKDAMRIAVPVEPEDKIGARREHLVGVLEREIESSPERMRKQQQTAQMRRGLRILTAAAALVATLGLGMWVSQLDHAHTTVASGQSTEPQDETTEPAPSAPHRSLAGTVLETTDGHQRKVDLAGGTKLALAANTRVAIMSDSTERQALDLTSGGISLDVPEGRKSRKVQVQTKHAQVIVTGTVFGVEVGRFDQPANSPVRTRVTVSRGQVVVSHERGTMTLEQGDSWTSPLITPKNQDNTETASAEPSPEREPVSAEEAADGSETPSLAASDALPSSQQQLVADQVTDTATRSQEHRASPSTLSEQNGLLEQALSAERRGNLSRAERLVDRFLAKYPRSPLRSSAVEVKRRLNETPD